jgi:4-amino-4-deoxy-L-arabinose transferase-like glycosyltransferase
MLKVDEKKLLALLLVWSFLLHLLFGLLIGPPNFWDHYEGRQYRNIAESLVEGRGYAEPITSMPLYNLVLAGLLWFFGYASLPLLLLHVGFGVTTTFFTYKIARDFFSSTVALLAGLLISIHPYLVKLTMQIIDTGPSVALTTFGMWLLIKAWMIPSFSAKYYGLTGVVLALATLARPSAGIYTIIFGLGLLLWFVVQRNIRLAIQVVGVLWLAWAAIMSPWWLRNYLSYHQFIPLTALGAHGMLKGHTAYYTRVHPIYDTDHYPYYDYPQVADDPSGNSSNKLCAQYVLNYIREHPVEAITTDLRKVVWLYTWHKVPRSLVDSKPRWDPVLNTVVDDGNPRPAPQDIIYSIYWVPTLILFLWGVFISRHRWRELVPIYLIVFANALLVSMVFADTRYRLEVDPYIAMWAAYGLVSFGVQFRRRFSVKPWSASILNS